MVVAARTSTNNASRQQQRQDGVNCGGSGGLPSSSRRRNNGRVASSAATAIPPVTPRLLLGVKSRVLLAFFSFASFAVVHNCVSVRRAFVERRRYRGVRSAATSSSSSSSSEEAASEATADASAAADAALPPPRPASAAPDEDPPLRRSRSRSRVVRMLDDDDELEETLSPPSAPGASPRTVDPMGTGGVEVGEYWNHHSGVNRYNTFDYDGGGQDGQDGGDDDDDDDDDGSCHPGAPDWQNTNPQTCNKVHELAGDFVGGLGISAGFGNGGSGGSNGGGTGRVELLGEGTVMAAWKVREAFPAKLGQTGAGSRAAVGQLRDVATPLPQPATNSSSGSGSDAFLVERDVVVRTLRFGNRFERENKPSAIETPIIFERNRIEALALGRMTSNPMVINGYGNCGYAVITEAAKTTFWDELKKMDELERRMGGDLMGSRDVGTGEVPSLTVSVWSSTALQQKLVWAYKISKLLHDIHSTDAKEARRPTLAHGDFGRTNLLVTNDGRIIVNDFNQGFLLHYRTVSHKGENDKKKSWEVMCENSVRGYHGLARTSRPPERYNETHGYIRGDKADIFGLGVLLIEIVTGREKPFDGTDVAVNGSPARLRRRVVPVPRRIYESDDVVTLVMLYAGLACLSANPHDRPTSYRVYKALHRTLAHSKIPAGQGVKRGPQTREQIMKLFLPREDLFADVQVYDDEDGGDGKLPGTEQGKNATTMLAAPGGKKTAAAKSTATATAPPPPTHAASPAGVGKKQE